MNPVETLRIYDVMAEMTTQTIKYWLKGLWFLNGKSCMKKTIVEPLFALR